MIAWLNHVAAIVAVAALCAGWAALQRWLGRVDPDGPGAGGCGGGCGSACAKECGDGD